MQARLKLLPAAPRLASGGGTEAPSSTMEPEHENAAWLRWRGFVAASLGSSVAGEHAIESEAEAEHAVRLAPLEVERRRREVRLSAAREPCDAASRKLDEITTQTRILAGQVFDEEVSWFALLMRVVLLLVTAATLMTGDYALARITVAYVLRIPAEGPNGWHGTLFALGIALSPVVIKLWIDHAVTRPLHAGDPAALRRFSRLLAVGSAATMCMIGATVVVRFLFLLHLGRTEVASPDTTYAPLLEQYPGSAGTALLLVGVVFAVGSALCLSIGLYELDVLARRIGGRSRQIVGSATHARRVRRAAVGLARRQEQLAVAQGAMGEIEQNIINLRASAEATKQRDLALYSDGAAAGAVARTVHDWGAPGFNWTSGREQVSDAFFARFSVRFVWSSDVDQPAAPPTAQAPAAKSLPRGAHGPQLSDRNEPLHRQARRDIDKRASAYSRSA